MTVKVELFVESTPSDDVFVLDDATQGVLDDTTYVLGGGPGPTGLPKDITSFAYSVNVSRGRARQLEVINAGICNVTLRNGGREFDPQFTPTSPIPTEYGPAVPGKRLRVSDGSTVIFDGIIQDWSYTWPIAPDQGDAYIMAIDNLGVLATQQFDEFTAPVELPGARIGQVLDNPTVNFPVGARDIDDGVTPLAAGTIPAQDALSYLQEVADSDLGRLFASRTNALTFRSRDNLASATIIAEFDDTGTEIPFDRIDVLYGADQLATVVTVTRFDGNTYQSIADDEHLAAYGYRALDRTVYSDEDEYAQQLAGYLLKQRQDPIAVIQSFGVNLEILDSGDRATVAGLEIGDLVKVTWTPTGSGTQIVQELVVEGVEYNQYVGDAATMAFRLSSAEGRFAFLLDSSVRGVLDTDTLGF